MSLGYFDDQRREYVINTPKTPYPWINYLGNDEFFSLLSNTAGGYSFYKDAKFRRLTRFRYNNVPVDSGGKYFYINDGGCVWSPAWKPARTDLDSYECRHGLGYSTIEGQKQGLSAAVTYFIPMGENAEVQIVRLKNTTDQSKTFKLYSFVEWCLWNAEDDGANFQRNFSTGEVEVEDSVIYHKTEYRERRNHYAFYSVNAPLAGFETDRDTFLGNANGFDHPDVVYANENQNSIAHGWSPIASHCLEIELAAGEERELVFVLGYQENAEDDKWESKAIINKTGAKEVIARYATPEQAKAALQGVTDYWSDRLDNYVVDSSDERLNRMVNVWNQYQCMVTFNFSRSASFFESGIGRGMGFRDSNQDLIGVIHLEPERARQRILDIAATQFEDGSAYHQYQPLTKRGNAAIGGNFNDDPLWLIQSVTQYTKETGDFSILDVQVPFNNDENNTGTLLAHLKASFNHVINKLGPHGLPLIGRADWNDCLNLNCFSKDPNESFQTTENKGDGKVAESVMIAGMFVYFGQDYAELCKEVGDNAEADRALTEIARMSDAIKQHGWDGEWFLRAYDAAGDKVGSKECDEGQIFIESQGFCVMAGVGLEDGKAEAALNSVEEHLSCDYGVSLLYPAYTEYKINLGEISTYPQGYKENGGIFCHNNPWIMIAETKLGRPQKAWEYYTKIAPAYQDDKIELHKTEPYVYAQMIAGKEAFKPGEAKNSWLTGTAAWNFHTIAEHILGVKPSYKGLLIDPCLPADFSLNAIKRQFRGASYNIEFIRQSPEATKVSKIEVNGQEIAGQVVPAQAQGSDNKVVVTLS